MNLLNIYKLALLFIISVFISNCATEELASARLYVKEQRFDEAFLPNKELNIVASKSHLNDETIRFINLIKESYSIKLAPLLPLNTGSFWIINSLLSEFFPISDNTNCIIC